MQNNGNNVKYAEIKIDGIKWEKMKETEGGKNKVKCNVHFLINLEQQIIRWKS